MSLSHFPLVNPSSDKHLDRDNVATVTQSRNLDDVNPATHDNGSNTSDVTTSAGAAKGPNPDERVGWGSSQVSAQDKFFGAQASALGDPKSIQHPYEHSQHNLGTIKGGDSDESTGHPNNAVQDSVTRGSQVPPQGNAFDTQPTTANKVERRGGVESNQPTGGVMNNQSETSGDIAGQRPSNSNVGYGNDAIGTASGLGEATEKVPDQHHPKHDAEGAAIGDIGEHESSGNRVGGSGVRTGDTVGTLDDHDKNQHDHDLHRQDRHDDTNTQSEGHHENPKEEVVDESAAKHLARSGKIEKIIGTVIGSTSMKEKGIHKQADAAAMLTHMHHNPDHHSHNNADTTTGTQPSH